MSHRLAALILTGPLLLANSSYALAATSQTVSAAATDASFILPINGVLGGSASAATVAFILPMNGSLSSAKPEQAVKEPSIKILPPVEAPAKTEAAPEAVPAAQGPIIIDNDEQETTAEAQYEWKEIADEPGKTHIEAGACFPVAVVSAISSKTAKVGDPVQARLKIDLNIGGKQVANKGDLVVGHVASSKKARRLLISELTPNKQWFRCSGSLGLQFDEIINSAGEHLPLVAKPARNARIVKNKAEGRVLGINYEGEIAAPLSGQLKAQALHLAIRAGASAAGVFSFGAVPVAYGIIGAIHPEFAFMHPVGLNVRHRRLKGAAMGVLCGLPAGGLVCDYIVHGPEAVIKPGDEFLAEFKQDFTGEAATDAQLLPGASTKVHGEVLPESKKKPGK